MGGPRRTPTEVLLKQGSFARHPERAAARADEPKPEGSVFKIPGLSLTAERFWPQVVDMLDECGVLTSMDSLALGLFCETYAEWREATDRYTRAPVVYRGTGKTRRLVKSPDHDILASTRKDLLRMLIEFGMTPASRSSVKATKKKQTQNRFAALMTPATAQPQQEGAE